MTRWDVLTSPTAALPPYTARFHQQFCQRKDWWLKNLAQNLQAEAAVNISHCGTLICFPYGIFSGVWKIHKWNNNYKWGIIWKQRSVFIPVHHLKGFLIKSILDYAGDDTGSHSTVCWVLFPGKDRSQGQENSCISSAQGTAEMWERWGGCLIPCGEHFLNNVVACSRKFCSASWGSDSPDQAMSKTDALKCPLSVLG